LALPALPLSAVTLLEAALPTAFDDTVEPERAVAPASLPLAAWATAELELDAFATAEDDSEASPSAVEPLRAFAVAEEWSLALVVAWLLVPPLSANDWAELLLYACAEPAAVPSALASALLALV
jgi:hypothetical protein